MRLRLKNMVLTLLTWALPPLRTGERIPHEAQIGHPASRAGADQVAGVLVRQQEGGLGDALADAAGLDLIG